MPPLRILTALLALTAALPAAEHFVSPRGNDAASGATTAEPFATIAKGISTLTPGDVLTILPGEYFESVLTTISGTLKAPITIRAQREGTVLVRGDVAVSGFSAVPGSRGVHHAPFQKRVEAVAERSTLRVLSARASLSELEALPGSWFHDESAGVLYVHATDSQSPDHHALTVSITNAHGLGFVGAKHVIVEGLAFTGFSNREYKVQQGSRARWGIFIRDGENMRVRRCTAFLNSGGIGLLAGGKDCVVEDCHAFANSSRYIDIGNNINGWSVSGTTFRNNRVQGFDPDASVSRNDITFYSGGKGNLMEGNIAVQAGLMVKGGQKDAAVRRNVVVGRKFYRDPDATNLQLADPATAAAQARYADPLQQDFRLQSDAPLRKPAKPAAEAGPYPYRDEVFFVSPQGDDAATGTSVKLAWRTIAHAAQRARPGDTVYVLAGTYSEALAPAQSGSPGKPIRFLRRGHDRVVLDGAGRLEAGIDLSKREHVEIRGFAIQNCRMHGVVIRDAREIKVEQTTVSGTGREAVSVSNSSGVRFAHNLLAGAGGFRIERSPAGIITGNLFSATSGASFVSDAESLAGLWMDYNGFAPAAGRALLAVSSRAFATLADWQSASRLDLHSVAGDPGFDPAAQRSGRFLLASSSPLIGRGPFAAPIGSFLRTMREVPAMPQSVKVRTVTNSTATVEWWQTKEDIKAVLEWGPTAKCEQQIEVAPAKRGIAGLVSLKPATEYYFRVAGRGAVESLVFADAADADAASERRFATEIQHLTTAAAALPARSYHVSAQGDNSRDGLAPERAFRTIGHAAEQVRAGDTVLVHAGTYEELVTLVATGDAHAPITFRAAPNEEVWLSGSNRARSTAFLVRGLHHIVLDGFRFRDFAFLDGQAIRIEGGSGHVVRRCFYDGRSASGYTPAFLGANSSADLLVENCVMIGGMGEGLTISRSPRPIVRHCVFYNNNIRAMTANMWDPKGTFTFTHNLVCDTIPSKTGNALIRMKDLENLRADHNAWFTRKGPEERALVEAMTIAGEDVWVKKPGSREGKDLLQADIRSLIGQEKSSVFGNPRFAATAELLTGGKGNVDHQEWLRRELRRTGANFGPLTFSDFIPAAESGIARASDGKPIGLDPAAFSGR